MGVMRSASAAIWARASWLSENSGSATVGSAPGQVGGKALEVRTSSGRTGCAASRFFDRALVAAGQPQHVADDGLAPYRAGGRSGAGGFHHDVAAIGGDHQAVVGSCSLQRKVTSARASTSAAQSKSARVMPPASWHRQRLVTTMAVGYRQLRW